MPKQKIKFAFIAMLIMALVGVAIILILTAKRGIGCRSDSVIYLYMARSFYDSGLKPMSLFSKVLIWQHFPPLFPLALSFAHYLGGEDAFIAGRWLQAILFGTNIFLVEWWVYRCTRSAGLAIIGALWMLMKINVVSIHAELMSEGLFLFFTLLWFYFLLLFLERSNIKLFYGCVLMTIAACMTRVVGVSLIFTGFLLLWWDYRKKKRTRGYVPIVFFLTSAFPMGIWFLKSHFEAGHFFSRKVFFHPEALQNLKGFAWPINFFNLSGVFLKITFVIFLLGITTWLLGKDSWKNAHYIKTLKRLLGSSTVFCIIYFLVLIVACVFFDPSAIDKRLFLPIQIFLLFICFSVIQLLFSLKTRSFLPKIFMGIFAAFWMIGLNINTAMAWAKQRYYEGVMYEGKKWADSEIIQQVKAMSRSILIYTNDFNAIYFLTQREALHIPSKINEFTLRPDPYYKEIMNRLKKDMERKRAVIVYFCPRNQRCDDAVNKQLGQEIPLEPLVTAIDGKIYGWKQSKFPSPI